MPSLPLRGSAYPVLGALPALEVLVLPGSGAPVVFVPSPYAPPVLTSVLVGNVDLVVDRASLIALVVALITAGVAVPTSSSCIAARPWSTPPAAVTSSDLRVVS